MTKGQKEKFVNSIKTLSTIIAGNSEAKGWTIDPEPKEIVVKLALVQTEISEAIESLRMGDPPDSHIPSYSGVEAELADVFIRVMHLSHRCGYRLPEAILAKIEYNKTREMKHGGKLF